MKISIEVIFAGHPVDAIIGEIESTSANSALYKITNAINNKEGFSLSNEKGATYIPYELLKTAIINADLPGAKK